MKRVAVIGAGISGLPAIKACLEEGFEVVCYERTDALGGTFNYRPHENIAGTSVMSTTVTNTSKELMAYSDFPAPAEFPNFMHHSMVLRYLQLYAEHKDLLGSIRFGTGVQKIARGADGRWAVSLSTGEVKGFDAVMVCTGRHSVPIFPAFSGIDAFRGVVLHSHHYRDPLPFEGKRVLVVGIGNSALDIAVDLTRTAKNVILSTRSGAWIMSRVGHAGLPYDVLTNTRLYHALLDAMPWSVKNYFVEHRAQQKLDHSLYGLRPSRRFFQHRPAINDALAGLLISGLITITDDVDAVKPHSVVTKSWHEFAVDAIIFCTGYTFSLPFIADCPIRDESALFKFVFPPSMSDLALIGFVDAIGSLAPISAGVFSGRLKHTLPETHFKGEVHKGPKIVNSFHYLDELAALVGCKPDLWKIAMKDLRLAARLLFGPNVSYVYRLNAGDWPGARQAIETVGARVRAPLIGRSAKTLKNSEKLATTGNTSVDATRGVVLSLFAALFGAGWLLLMWTPSLGFWPHVCASSFVLSTLVGVVLAVCNALHGDFYWF